MIDQPYDDDRTLIIDDSDDDIRQIISIATEMPYRSEADLAHLLEMRGGPY